MRKLLSIFSLVLLYVTIAFGQAVDFQVLVEDNVGNSQVLNFGLDLTATDGIDAGLGESDLPPPPPGNAFDARFWLPPFAGALSSWKDYRAPGATPPGAFPFTGQKSHVIKFQTTNFPITISWSGLPPEILASSVIEDPFGLGSASFSGTGNFVITNGAIPQANITIDYNNIGPAGPEPQFAISPPSLSFGGVAVGSPSTLQATVSNAGPDPLTISGIVSSDPQFVIAPTTATVPAGGNQVFDVTFTPTSLGSFSATLSFTHDGVNVGSPFEYSVAGVGADAGPTFGVTPTSLTFPTVFVGNSADKILTVSNDGLTNTLNITSVTTTNGDYSVLPTTATIAPGANQVFTVTFAPTSDGTIAGDVVFAHDGPGPTTSVPVTGVGFTPPTVSGLVFEQDTAFVNENTSDIEANMQLLGTVPGIALHALQFRLLSNMAGDDNTILTYQGIAKAGSIASDANWILETNVVRGPINANGASEDTIYVLLYNISSSGDIVGDKLNLLHVKYRTAVLPPLVASDKSSFTIFNAEGSTFDGNLIDITPTDPELQVIVEAAGGTNGDVNGDGCVDILDLIMVVDHITGRDSLTGAEFDRADIAPWVSGDTDPSPDGIVNVQDLSVIQSIILTGFYPSGDPVTPCGYLSKVDGEADATVTLYINAEGISAYIDSDIGIRGAQIEFGSVSNNPENLVINTPLGQGYYQLSEGLFRTLMYDRAGQKYLNAGVNQFMADMPFVLTNPNDVTVAKIVLVNMDTKKIGNIVVQTIYGTTAVPLDYVLFQNYPNPFNPTTAIQFQVPKTSDVKIAVYDMLGQEVRTLVAGEVMRGTYTVDWDGFNNYGAKVASGTYIYRMTAGEFMQTKKMVLIK